MLYQKIIRQGSLTKLRRPSRQWRLTEQSFVSDRVAIGYGLSDKLRNGVL